MRGCDEAHRQFDAMANGEGKVGEVPSWMRVRGRAFWWVYQGAYEGLPRAFETFHRKGAEAEIRPAGLPGDIYVCDPAEHEGDPEHILTVLWIPVE